MATRPAHRNLAWLLTFLFVVPAGACSPGNAGESEGLERPQAAAVADNSAGQAAQQTSAAGSPAAGSTRPATGGASGQRPAEAAPALVVAEGTAMAFTTDQTVTTEKNKVGDRFTGRLTDAVLGEDGTTILEPGTVGRWVVNESTEKNAEGNAVLAVALEAVQVGDTWYPVTATVTDLALKTDNRDSGTETAAKIGIGAAAGALAGKIIGGSTGATLKGAGAGAAIGTAVALATKGGSASIQQGSKITVTLDQQLQLPPTNP